MIAPARVVLTVLVLALAGCAGDDEAPAPAQSPVAAPAGSSAPAAAPARGAPVAAGVTTTPTVTSTPTASSTPTSGLSDRDRQWLIAAHQAHLAEIAAGTDASRHAVNAALDGMGAELVRDHTALDRTVTELAGKYRVDLPAGMSDDQRSALYGLLNLPSTSYDAAWVRWQTREHRTALAAVESEKTLGTAPDVVAAARAAEPVLRRHLNELNVMADDLGVQAPTTVTGGTGGQAAAALHARNLPIVALGLFGAGLIGAELLLRRRRRTGPAG